MRSPWLADISVDVSPSTNNNFRLTAEIFGNYTEQKMALSNQSGIETHNHIPR